MLDLLRDGMRGVSLMFCGFSKLAVGGTRRERKNADSIFQN
jgi:hypothetical protein